MNKYGFVQQPFCDVIRYVAMTTQHLHTPNIMQLCVCVAENLGREQRNKLARHSHMPSTHTHTRADYSPSPYIRTAVHWINQSQRRIVLL